MKKATLIVALVAGSGFTVSCVQTSTVLDPTHCAGNDGDGFCARQHPDGSAPYCHLGTSECDAAAGITDPDFDGCLADRPEDACYSPCGEGLSVVEDPACESVADTTMTSDDATTQSGSSSTGDPTTDGTTGEVTETGPTDGMTTGGACVDNDDCPDAAAPFCDDSGTCVDCSGMPDGNAACTDADAGMPVCSEGTCVQCTTDQATACDGQTPLCGEDNTCQPCTEHSHCPDTACHLDGDEVGACFDAGDVVMVANDAALGNALAGLGATDDVVIQLASATYLTTATISGGAEVAIIGPASATLDGGGGFGVNVAAGSFAYLSGVSVADGSDTGVRCIGTSVWLDDMRVSGNSQVGLDISGGCAAHLRRTVVRANDAGGIAASGNTTEVYLENSAVVDNTNTNSIPAIGLQNSADIFAVYSTIADNLAGLGDTDSIVCSGSSGEVRNSIVLGAEAGSVSGCDGVTFSYSAVDMNGLGGTNLNVGAHDDAWFANPSTGNFHLSAAGETMFMDIAQWQDGDPVTDVDGDPILTDMPSFPGYDQP